MRDKILALKVQDFTTSELEDLIQYAIISKGILHSGITPHDVDKNNRAITGEHILSYSDRTFTLLSYKGLAIGVMEYDVTLVKDKYEFFKALHNEFKYL